MEVAGSEGILLWLMDCTFDSPLVCAHTNGLDRGGWYALSLKYRHCAARCWRLLRDRGRGCVCVAMHLSGAMHCRCAMRGSRATSTSQVSNWAEVRWSLYERLRYAQLIEDLIETLFPTPRLVIAGDVAKPGVFELRKPSMMRDCLCRRCAR